MAQRVLVIDDEATIRAALCATLGDAGYAVAAARDGVEGVETLRSESADAVVMDIYMPLKDGFETIRELRRVAPEVKIIAISGGGRYGLNLLDGLEQLGATDTLAKPFGKDAFLSSVARALESAGK